VPVPLQWLIHCDVFFRFDELFFQPGGNPLGCAVLWRENAGAKFSEVKLE
jgi:hypothetical protein